MKAKARNILIVMASAVLLFTLGCTNPYFESVKARVNVARNGPVAAPTFTPQAGTYSGNQSISISCATVGAEIFYTSDGTTPTASSSRYSTPISVAGDGTAVTIKAVAMKDEMADSPAVSAAFVIDYSLVSTPNFTPPAGTYSTDQAVAIACSTTGATIYYTTDGSTPTTSSAVYSAAIPVNGSGTSLTIKALATKSLMTDSNIASASYTIAWDKVQTPTFSPLGGSYSSDQSVSISTSTSGASIYYTTDGSTPTTGSSPYSSSIPVAGNGTSLTLKAIAVKGGMLDSAAGSATFDINYSQASTPNFSPSAGSYGAAQVVTITSTTPGVSIRYTTDGSTPTSSVGTLYSAAVNVSGSMTLRAIAYGAGWADSTVSSAVYTLPVATPSFSPVGGTYAGGQSVTILTTTPGASIRYTTNGSTPTSTVGTLYSAPVPVNGSMTLRAIAYEAGWSDSVVSAATYVLPVAAPTFSPGTGTYSGAQSVTVSTTTPGATIRYTTNGSTPTSTTGTVYAGPVAVTGSMTLKAIAYEAGWTDSPVSSAVYTLPVATPNFGMAGGTYWYTMTISIFTSTPGATIRYTTDGSMPTSTVGTVYSASVPVNGSMTIKAIAYEAGWTDSSVASATYVLQPNQPTVAPTGGSALYTDLITLSNPNTPASLFAFTTDGSLPTESSGTVTHGTLYTTPFTLPQGVITLKAISFLPLWTDSAVKSASFIVTGFITTVVGTGTSGYTGDSGPAISATIGRPMGLVFDAAGNLFIADSDNFVVRKVDTGGFITTFAGTGVSGSLGDGGPATSAQLGTTYGLAVDSAGNLYIADTGNNKVRKVSGGIMTTFAGNGTSTYSGDGGLATAAGLKGPSGVAVDPAGNVYVSTQSDHRVRMIDTGGIISTVVGDGTAGFLGDGGPATGAELNTPVSIAVDNAGVLYICDKVNQRVRKVSGGIITTIAGTGTNGIGGDGGLATSALVNYPTGVAVDSAGNVYVVDQTNNRVRKIVGGYIYTLAGNSVPGYLDGPAATANINQPQMAAVDLAGNLFVGDRADYRVRKIY